MIRSLLSASAVASISFSLGDASEFIEVDGGVSPVRVTSGPDFHWFGYYDKLQFDPSERYLLGMKVGFEGRSPKEDDVIEIGMVDLGDGDRWIRLGETRSWGWQQGCMLQWRPGSQSEVMWNDRDGDRFICRVKDVFSGEERTLPAPIYALSPDGAFAVGAHFERIQDMRMGYGYPGVTDADARSRAPETSGAYRLDIESGDVETIVSLKSAADVPYEGKPLLDKWNYFNHLLVSPDSKRFVFLHRWRDQKRDKSKNDYGGFTTRMFSAAVDGSDLFLLDGSGKTSHFIWKNPRQLCMWTKPAGLKERFYIFDDRSDRIAIVGEEAMPKNGHNLYLPFGDGEWILNDTYPRKEDRKQTLYLFHPPSGKKIILGRFVSPPRYKGEWRCDLHCRFSSSGKKLCFDSTHEELGRQLYVIDLTKVKALTDLDVW